jgi:hypothetical protein
MLDNKHAKETAAPSSGSVTIWDEGKDHVTGFGLRIHAGGKRSFFINYRIDGRERRQTIGAYPRWSVSAARERAKELRKRIEKGEDPAGEKRARREAPTIADLIERYVTEHLPTTSAGPVRQND